jgi:hypothetical protein
MTRIADESVHAFDHGRLSSIGATALRLTTIEKRAAKGVEIKAAVTNTGTLYVGNSDVTADAADATSGFPLHAGDAIFLPVDDPTSVYLIGSTTGQKAFFVVL